MAEEQGKSSPVKVTNTLSTKLTLNRISPGSFSPPTDVTLKLSDGSIDAHKMILAAVSPVFERMFYGDFKEGKSKEVDLPKENYDTIKLLIDFVYKGSCDLDNLDTILPLIAAFDYYQINKVPLQHMCGEAILSQLDSSNYLTLLPKYVSVMSEESHKKAADKVMSYTNNDFINTLDETKDLPEEVMLHLLKHDNVRICEMDIFEFLVHWYDYQVKKLSKSILLIKELFHSIRYLLIPPRLLMENVADCSHVDKEVFAKAFDYMYRKPKAGDSDKPRVPKKLMGTLSTGTKGLSVAYSSENECLVSCRWEHDLEFCKNIVTSNLLTNGIYALKITNAPDNLLFRITDSTQNGLCCDNIIYNGYLIVLNVYDDDAFLKIIKKDSVKLAVSAAGLGPFKFSFMTMTQGKVSFKIRSYTWS